MHPRLVLQPVESISTEILRAFVLGKPLTSEQRNFLERYYRKLSSPAFDPIYNYYIASTKKMPVKSFLLPTSKINIKSLEQFKKRLQFFMQKNMPTFTLQFTQEEFKKFQQLNISNLILWHGNQLLTGAPFFPGGIPPVIFFQFGNYFGVTKYVVLPGEKALKANILIYFEDMLDRNLDQCVHDYQQKLQLEISQQHKILSAHHIQPEDYRSYLIHTLERRK